MTLNNRQFNIIMVVILLFASYRLINNFENPPVVADWLSFIGAEFALQVLYNNFKR